MKGIVAAGAVLAAIGWGQTPVAFEVASVKPHVFARNEFSFSGAFRESPIRISGTRVTVQGLLGGLVMAAYQLRPFQVAGLPEWRDATGRNPVYDIEAKAPGEAAPPMDEARRMLQALLADRFHLRFHRETKEQPVYHLIVAGKAKLTPSAPDAESRTVSRAKFRTSYVNVSVAELAAQLGPQFDRPLFDRTGLKGGYDFSLEYMPNLAGRAGLPPDEAAAFAKEYPPDEAPPLAVALLQQLGLKLTPAREPVEILVIDHVARPTAN